MAIARQSTEEVYLVSKFKGNVSKNKGFRTDAEIGINGGFESDKDLQAWEDDGEECMDGAG